MKKSLYTPGQQTIAATIRQMRESAGMSQRDLAEKLGRPLNVVSRIESAQRRVDFLEWIALCDACSVDPASAGRKLLTGLIGNSKKK